MCDLIGRFGNHRADASSPEPSAGRSTRIGLVAADAVGAGTWPTTVAAIDFQAREQMLEHRAVVCLAGADQDDQRPAGSIDEVMDLAGLPAAGAANAVVRRLDARILVIRPSPLCGG